MSKTLQTILLILTVSLGIAFRMTIFGWLFLVGLLTIIIFGISHIVIHIYAMTYLSSNKTSNIAKIVVSHLLFISIFLFQIDFDDSKSYSIFGFITGLEKTAFIENGFSIVLFSIIGYVIMSIFIIRETRKAKLKNNVSKYLFSSIAGSVILPFFILKGIYSNRDIQYSKELEKTGEYNSIKRALKEPDKVILLKINPYEYKLDEIPLEIFQFKNLKEIDFTDNNISNIPNNILQAKNLEIVNLIGNNITEIPAKLCECNNLRELRIGGNIKNFPECLKTMKSLQHLSIQSNTVNELMEELIGFENIETAHFYLKSGTINGKKLDSIYSVTGIQHKY